MALKDIASKTGDAKIDRQGQTTQGNNMASDPHAKATRRPSPTDLRP